MKNTYEHTHTHTRNDHANWTILCFQKKKKKKKKKKTSSIIGGGGGGGGGSPFCDDSGSGFRHATCFFFCYNCFLYCFKFTTTQTSWKNKKKIRSKINKKKIKNKINAKHML